MVRSLPTATVRNRKREAVRTCGCSFDGLLTVISSSGNSSSIVGDMLVVLVAVIVLFCRFRGT